ncbi:hypothetical protein H0H87_001091 [Tephrocybe sp. NHM501043]|nr:hypothetical protein H0H87_001091 [Tephrocybe sp. NHM501043]
MRNSETGTGTYLLTSSPIKQQHLVLDAESMDDHYHHGGHSPVIRITDDSGRSGSTDKYRGEEEQDTLGNLPPLRPNRRKGPDIELGGIDQTTENSVSRLNTRASNVNHMVHNFTSPIGVRIVHAVRLKIELSAAEKALSRRKEIQTADYYSHAAPAARRCLDAERETATDTVTTLKKLLSYAHNRVQEPNSPNEIDVETLDLYIDELDEWIVSLRHFMCLDPDNEEDPAKWTWRQIEVSVANLVKLMEEIIADDFMENYTNFVEADGAMVLGTEVEKRRQHVTGNWKNAKELLCRAKHVCSAVQDLEEARMKLVEHVSRGKEEIVFLQNKLDVLDVAQFQIQEQLDTFTRWAEQDKSSIEDLSKRLQYLWTLPTSTSQPPVQVLEVIKGIVDKEAMSIAKEIHEKMTVSSCVENGINGEFERVRPSELLDRLTVVADKIVRVFNSWPKF